MPPPPKPGGIAPWLYARLPIPGPMGACCGGGAPNEVGGTPPGGNGGGPPPRSFLRRSIRRCRVHPEP